MPELSANVSWPKKNAKINTKNPVLKIRFILKYNLQKKYSIDSLNISVLFRFGKLCITESETINPLILLSLIVQICHIITIILRVYAVKKENLSNIVEVVLESTLHKWLFTEIRKARTVKTREQSLDLCRKLFHFIV